MPSTKRRRSERQSENAEQAAEESKEQEAEPEDKKAVHMELQATRGNNKRGKASDKTEAAAKQEAEPQDKRAHMEFTTKLVEWVPPGVESDDEVQVWDAAQISITGPHRTLFLDGHKLGPLEYQRGENTHLIGVGVLDKGRRRGQFLDFADAGQLQVEFDDERQLESHELEETLHAGRVHGADSA